MLLLNQAAWTLVSLSTAPTAVRACAQTYATLLNSTSDNNVKLIVLDRLSELKKHHTKVVQEILMDILRALSSPNIDICKKVLALAIDMVGPRNIEEVRKKCLLLSPHPVLSCPVLSHPVWSLSSLLFHGRPHHYNYQLVMYPSETSNLTYLHLNLACPYFWSCFILSICYASPYPLFSSCNWSKSVAIPHPTPLFYSNLPCLLVLYVQVMQVLKREVVRAQEADLEHGEEYKSLLIQAIHRYSIVLGWDIMCYAMLYHKM